MEVINTPASKVYIGDLETAKFNKLISKYEKSQIVMIADENTINLHPYLLECAPYLEDCEIIQIDSGEKNKSIEMVVSIWLSLTEMKITRKGLVINLGGGVITDMGGFIASTFKRGIDFINIPTTLLSMVDASVGGKTGIDLAHFKNQIGVFAEPKAVFCDPIFLESLPKRQITSGFAEVLKHGLIKSADYWKYCSLTPFNKLDWGKVIFESVKIKNEVVTSDPTEKGDRKLLNFGHTVGHAIESLYLNQAKPVFHGEAIAAGMIIESYLSVKINGLDTLALSEIEAVLNKQFKRLNFNESHYEELINLMHQDKKNEGGFINFSLLYQIGSASINHNCSVEIIREALAYYNEN